MTYNWEQAKRWECSGLVDVCLNPLLAIHDPESSSLVQLFFLYCAAYLSVSVQNLIEHISNRLQDVCL